jgi:hypothetical protein
LTSRDSRDRASSSEGGIVREKSAGPILLTWIDRLLAETGANGSQLTGLHGICSAGGAPGVHRGCTRSVFEIDGGTVSAAQPHHEALHARVTFGLVAVNRYTQERTVKPSART